MRAEPKYQITYTLKARDYAAMARALTRRPWQRSIVILVLWLFSVWCLLVFFTDVYNPVTMINDIAESSFWFWLPTCLLLVALLSLATHWLAWGASFLYYRQSAPARATITVHLSDDAIQVKSNVAIRPFHGRRLNASFARKII